MSGGHVLVIEDDEWVARLLAVGLREAGHRVTLCAGGAEGIAAVHREEPDCVVCDVVLGDDDGYAIGRSMRQTGGRVAGTPLVYLCAGDEDADTKVEALRNGGDAFLAKPYRIDEVALTVTALIRLAQRNRGLDTDGRVSPAPPMPSSRPPPADAPDGVLEGDLAKVSVATVLTVLEMEKHTGDLEMVNAGHVARLHIGSGNVDGAQLGDTAAEPIVVLRTVLTWTGGRFIFVPTRKPERKMTGRATIGALLMEAARLEDEFRAGLPGREERRSSLPPRSSRGESSWLPDAPRGDGGRGGDASRLSDAFNLGFPSSPPGPVSTPAPPPASAPAPGSTSGPTSSVGPASTRAQASTLPPASTPTPTPPASTVATPTPSAVTSPLPAPPRRPVTGPAPTAVPRPPLKRPVSGVGPVIPPATPSPSPVALRPPPGAAIASTVTLPEAGRASRPVLSSGALDDGWGSDDDEAPVSLSAAEIVEPARRGPPPVPPPRPTTSPTGVDVKAAQQRLAAQQAGLSTPPPPATFSGPPPAAPPGDLAALPERDPALPGPARPEPILPEPILPEPTLPDPTLPEPILPEPTLPDQVGEKR